MSSKRKKVILPEYKQREERQPEAQSGKRHQMIAYGMLALLFAAFVGSQLLQSSSRPSLALNDGVTNPLPASDPVTALSGGPTNPIPVSGASTASSSGQTNPLPPSDSGAVSETAPQSQATAATNIVPSSVTITPLGSGQTNPIPPNSANTAQTTTPSVENDLASLTAAEKGQLGIPALMWFHAAW